jgi:hypothetical protein
MQNSAVIRFLHAKNTCAVEIHRESYAVYGQIIISEEIVKQWCRMFKDWRRDVCDEERSSRPSAVSDDLDQSVIKKSVKDGASQSQNFRVTFHKFHAFFSTRLRQIG